MDSGAFFLCFMLLLLPIITIIGLLVIKKLTTHIKISDTVVVVRDGKYANGKVIGNLISKKSGKNGRQVITYMPIDTETGKPVTIISNPSNIITYEKGIWSNERAIIEVLPCSAQDYINNLLSSIETKNAETMIINAQREGLNRTKTHLKEIGEGELSEESLGLNQAFLKALLRNASKEDKSKIYKPLNIDNKGTEF